MELNWNRIKCILNWILMNASHVAKVNVHCDVRGAIHWDTAVLVLSQDLPLILETRLVDLAFPTSLEPVSMEATAPDLAQVNGRVRA
jgi:hypothetical protein